MRLPRRAAWVLRCDGGSCWRTGAFRQVGSSFRSSDVCKLFITSEIDRWLYSQVRLLAPREDRNLSLFTSPRAHARTHVLTVPAVHSISTFFLFFVTTFWPRVSSNSFMSVWLWKQGRPVHQKEKRKRADKMKILNITYM